MSELDQVLDEYLALRRRLGYLLRDVEPPLRKFIAFLEQQRAEYVTSDLALRWARLPEDVQPAHWAARLSTVRCFARYVSAVDPRTEVPPIDLLSHRFRRKAPYIYTDAEIVRLIEAAKQLHSVLGLRGLTYATLFGLVAVAGLRHGECIALNLDDVDLAAGVLTVRRTKFGKTRLIPIHDSTQHALHRYAQQRDQLLPQRRTRSFFVSDQGRRLTRWTVRYTFVKLSRQIGLRGPRDRRGPRIHDLRHSYAVQTMLRWYRSDVDVERNLPRLATYLGHVHVNDTYWYISAVPELLQLATQRLERAGTSS